MSPVGQEWEMERRRQDHSRCCRGVRIFLTVALFVAAGCGSAGGSSAGPRPPCLPLEPGTDLVAAAPAGARAARDVDESYPDFQPLPDPVAPSSSTEVAETLEGYIARVVAERGRPFDWNRADDAALCAAIERGAGPLVVGVEGAGADRRRRALDALGPALARILGHAPRIASRSDRLGTLRVSLDACSQLGAIRALPGVAFVEVACGPADVDARMSIRPERATDVSPPRDEEPFNPGLYDPTDGTYPSYADFMEHVDPDAATRIRRQHVGPVYDELGDFGSSDIGVAVLDNGVFAEWVPFLSTGRGTYRTAGYHPPDIGETHPQDSDFFGLSRIIPDAFDHGTRQSRHVQSFAPHANRATVRSSSLPFIFLPDDFTGVTNAILAMADDDAVQIVSMSMGTIIRSHEMERAIEEFHGRGKILIAAAGTTFPGLRDLIGVVFPATLPIVVSSTGLSDTEQTGGVFELGEVSHGGPENDFVIEPSPASSESVSTLAGIIATLWAIDPGQPRESILDALIRSSNFYRETRSKDPLFGWGRIDARAAARTIQEGGCDVQGGP